MKWVKANERLPEATNGYAKQIVTKWTFDDGNFQLRTTTANALIDRTKFLTDSSKIEWLDESESIPSDVEILKARIREVEAQLEHAENAAGMYQEQFQQAVTEIKKYQ